MGKRAPQGTGTAYDGLPPRYKLFVDSVLSGKSYLQAALAAGYSKSRAGQTGSLIAKKRQVQAAMAEKRQPAAQLVVVDRALLTGHCLRIIETAPRQADQVSALTLLAKLHGLNAPDKIAATTADGADIPRDTRTDLAAVLVGIAARITSGAGHPGAGGDPHP